MNKYFPIVLTFLVVISDFAPGQTVQPTEVELKFKVNKLPVSMSIPPNFEILRDPNVLKQYPYPNNQNLYFMLLPFDRDDFSYVSIGSRPEFDANDVSLEDFTTMAASASKIFQTEEEFTILINSVKSLANEWRKNAGQPNAVAAKNITTFKTKDAFFTVGIVETEKGKFSVNCVSLQFHKGKIIVIGASSKFKNDADIIWAMVTVESIRKLLR